MKRVDNMNKTMTKSINRIFKQLHEKGKKKKNTIKQ